jgi:hypothetical protein
MLENTQEQCDLCCRPLEVWFFTPWKMVLWCPLCLATTVYQTQQSLFDPVQPALPDGGANGLERPL